MYFMQQVSHWSGGGHFVSWGKKKFFVQLSKQMKVYSVSDVNGIPSLKGRYIIGNVGKTALYEYAYMYMYFFESRRLTNQPVQWFQLNAAAK